MNLTSYRWRNYTEASYVEYYKYSGVRPPTLFELMCKINSEPSMSCTLSMLDISGMRKTKSFPFQLSHLNLWAFHSTILLFWSDALHLCPLHNHVNYLNLKCFHFYHYNSTLTWSFLLLHTQALVYQPDYSFKFLMLTLCLYCLWANLTLFSLLIALCQETLTLHQMNDSHPSRLYNT